MTITDSHLVAEATQSPIAGGSAVFGNEIFPPELIKQAIAPAWKDCPVGTIAYSHTGTKWTKQTNGWWRANGGDAFPTPGAGVCLVRLPNSNP